MKRLICLLILMVSAFALPQYKTDGSDEPQKLKKLEKAYVSAKSAYTKKKDESNKKKLVVATVKLGTASMTSPSLDRKIKYKKALGLYREALKLDPKNEEARNNSEMIISIYKSMGRPVPQ